VNATTCYHILLPNVDEVGLTETSFPPFLPPVSSQNKTTNPPSPSFSSLYLLLHHETSNCKIHKHRKILLSSDRICLEQLLIFPGVSVFCLCLSPHNNISCLLLLSPSPILSQTTWCRRRTNSPEQKASEPLEEEASSATHKKNTGRTPKKHNTHTHTLSLPLSLSLSLKSSPNTSPPHQCRTRPPPLLAFKHLSKSGSKTQKRKSTNHTHTSLHLLLVLFPSSATHLLHDPYKESHAKGKKGGTAKPLFAATKLVSHGCDATDNLLQEAGERVGGSGGDRSGQVRGVSKKKNPTTENTRRGAIGLRETQLPDTTRE
jgi:hypothetical protein